MRAGGRHGADDRLGEGARLARGADERAGTEPPDDLLELDPTAHRPQPDATAGSAAISRFSPSRPGPVGEDEPARIEQSTRRDSSEGGAPSAAMAARTASAHPAPEAPAP